MDVVEIENFGPAIICPYNKAHVIPAHRIQWHLSKCQRQYPKAKIAVCIFNTSHHIPEAELRAHHRNCPDRVLVEVFKYPIDMGGPVTSKLNHPKPQYNQQDEACGYKPSNDENWDDMDAPRYDPQQYCINNPVVRKATHKTPSAKREFYRTERMRITEILKKREAEETSKELEDEKNLLEKLEKTKISKKG